MRSLDNVEQLTLLAVPDSHQALGPSIFGDFTRVVACLPSAENVCIESEALPMNRLEGTDYFFWEGANTDLPTHYRFLVETKKGDRQHFIDAYSFEPIIDKQSLRSFREGQSSKAQNILGAHVHSIDGIRGVRLAVWAPTAQSVSVVGEFNRWDGRQLHMRSLQESGVWILFLPGADASLEYQYEIKASDGVLHYKVDPYSLALQLDNHAVSRTISPGSYPWGDLAWRNRRTKADWRISPISIYEVHAGSWRRDDGQEFFNFRELADSLIPYVNQMGYTHIQLMPLAEHPFYGSWGYQVVGYFSLTTRYGSIEDFKYFVDVCHQFGIGIILDWVPGHFPKDSYGLARFDGQCLYEHPSDLRSEHREWGTLNFDYSKGEVRSFLISSALYWIREFHLDGIRIDAVASMLFHDYAAQSPSQWLPNEHGGNENEDAIRFLKDLNREIKSQCPGVITIAEESTTFPNVTSVDSHAGLGFDMKWDLGWVHDTLGYFREDPLFRKHHHQKLTFGMSYHHCEQFLIPFSHDEVVYGKGSLISKMPGDQSQAFSNLRLLFMYFFTYPSKKLMFMGQELGQWTEWDHDQSLDWDLLNYSTHRGIRNLVSELNSIYRVSPSLYAGDFKAEGFEWLDCNDAERSVVAYARHSPGESHVIVLNLTSVTRKYYALPLPKDGLYTVVCHTNNTEYGGDGNSCVTEIVATPEPLMGRDYSTNILLAPYAGVLLKWHSPDN